MERSFLKTYFIFLFFLILKFPQTESRVFQKPNADDIDYWHNYNLNHLKNVLTSNNADTKIAKNVILFIGDGMSFSTSAAGRVLKGQLEGKSGEETELVFEDFPHVALAKTYNTDSQVPDSAGTATALLSGIKTSLGSVGLSNPPSKEEVNEKDRLKNIMDWAQEENKRTGIVTTTR
jgi:alkaline phosphatase